MNRPVTWKRLLEGMFLLLANVGVLWLIWYAYLVLGKITFAETLWISLVISSAGLIGAVCLTSSHDNPRWFTFDADHLNITQVVTLAIAALAIALGSGGFAIVARGLKPHGRAVLVMGAMFFVVAAVKWLKRVLSVSRRKNGKTGPC